VFVVNAIHFLKPMTMQKFLLAILLLSLPVFAQQKSQNLKIDQERLEKRILDLAQYGMLPNGETNRVAFSDADVAAHQFVMEMMREAGLEVHIDAAGNLIGNRAGKKVLKPIVFGSHIDMVPQGGNYDGCVGAMGAIEVIKTLSEQNFTTDHPLQVIIFANEEGGLVGSRAISGNLKASGLAVKNSTGYTIEEGIKRLGGNPENIVSVARKQGDMAAFVELHIEQGAKLYENKIQIGIVEGIVGIKWWDVTFEGFANHAGTTAMNNRKDALLAAAKFIQAVNEVAIQTPGNHVATVGRIQALPGAPNVIPGKVVLSLEIRDLSAEKIETVFHSIQAKAAEISKNSGVAIDFSPIDATSSPALTDPVIQTAIQKASESLGYTYQYMPSGAGHDAQDMALVVPTGMIFVPSKDGISHSPEEYTSPEDMANGANVLLHTILELDKKLKN
jgi:N-carbamoyl-L-amino-acid hydrolase